MKLHLFCGLLAAFCLFLFTGRGDAEDAPCPGESTRVAAIYQTDRPDADPALPGRVRERIERAGFHVTFIDDAVLTDPAELTSARFALLVLPDGRVLPSGARAVIDCYLRGGGDLIALRAPLGVGVAAKVDGRWVSPERYQRAHAAEPPPHVVFDFASTDRESWERSHSPEEGQGVARVVADSPGATGRSLHVTTDRFVIYDQQISPEVRDPFPADHVVTVFSAKGGPGTTRLAVEWDERDGSRWIASVPLTTEWRQYVLWPRDFAYWHSEPSRAPTSFEPRNALRVRVGLAESHTRSLDRGPQAYWIAHIGTAPGSEVYAQLFRPAPAPVLEALSPAYKFFACRDVARLAPSANQQVITDLTLRVPAKCSSPHPRPTGAGFDRGRHHRFIPLVTATSEDGRWRGTPVTMCVHADGPFAGGVWASFAVDDRDWYREPATLDAIEQVARRMVEGVFIIQGGADRHTYRTDEVARLGVDLYRTPTGRCGQVRVTVEVAPQAVPSGSDRSSAHDRAVLRLDPGQRLCREIAWDAGVTAGAFDCRVEVHADIGASPRPLIDAISQEVHIWDPDPDVPEVIVDDGRLKIDGTIWRPHGINYMPTSGIGQENRDLFEFWLSDPAYAPDVVQRDLEHVKALGFNAVAIFIYQQHARDGNLLDILRRCETLGLRVNLGLRPGPPDFYDWSVMLDIMHACRLADHRNVFAYDIAWEPIFGTHEQRQQWDHRWREWIIDRYGSMESAEGVWRFDLPRTFEGAVTNPLPHQVDQDGLWRAMTAAYRRFLDGLVYDIYRTPYRLLHEADPHTLVSFRMSCAGNPTYHEQGRITYDFPYLAGAVDFLGPEAYGRIGDWDKVKPGWFSAAYGRWAAPHLPFVWTEAGVSTWDLHEMAGAPNMLAFQAEFYRDIYRMLIGSAADGVFFWWYAGGFRFNERSDFGIVNPDGTDRPVTAVIREFGPKFLNAPPPATPDTWITIDRDRHPDGLSGIYAEVAEMFWQAVASGRTPGLRTAGTGTTSADVPLDKVGDTAPGQRGPLKYLDAAFDRVALRVGDGPWVVVRDGEAVRVPRDAKLMCRVTLRNLGEARWLSEGRGKPQAGAVKLHIAEKPSKDLPIPHDAERFDVVELDGIELGRMPQGQVRIPLRLMVARRTFFGPGFELHLISTD